MTMRPMKMRIGDIELRTCDKALIQTDRHTTAEIVDWSQSCCVLLASWRETEAGYSLRFNGSAPFEYEDSYDILTFWRLAKIGDEYLQEYFDNKKEFEMSSKVDKWMKAMHKVNKERPTLNLDEDEDGRTLLVEVVDNGDCRITQSEPGLDDDIVRLHPEDILNVGRFIMRQYSEGKLSELDTSKAVKAWASKDPQQTKLDNDEGISIYSESDKFSPYPVLVFKDPSREDF